MEAVPNVDIATAERIAQDGFGWEQPGATILNGERDANFLIETAAGKRFVLKVANTAEGISAVDMQQSVFQYLEPVIENVPRIVRSSDGSTIYRTANEADAGSGEWLA